MMMPVPFFFHNYTPFCSELSLNKRRFVLLDCSVYESQVSIKIHYFKPELEHLIEQYTMEMINAIKSNSILRCSGWRAETVFVEDISDSTYFDSCVDVFFVFFQMILLCFS